MRVIRDLEQFPSDLRGGAVAIGKFDGVHRGHGQLVDRLLHYASAVGGPSIVFTFDPPPTKILFPGSAPTPLCTTDRKAELLGRLGVDAMVAYPTNRAFLDWSARRFYDEIILHSLEAKAMVEGYNFFFGHSREGDIELLDQYCNESGVSLEVVQPVIDGDKPISSSRIRALVREGKVEEANRLLTGPYCLCGKVIVGDQRGRTLGYPTANIEVVDTLTPGLGIYAGVTTIDGEIYPAAIAVGPNLTFRQVEYKIEAHLVGFQGDIYGREICVEVVARLRDLERFSSPDLLVKQMGRDIQRAVEIVADRTAT